LHDIIQVRELGGDGRDDFSMAATDIDHSAPVRQCSPVIPFHGMSRWVTASSLVCIITEAKRRPCSGFFAMMLYIVSNSPPLVATSFKLSAVWVGSLAAEISQEPAIYF
jgi:hypothetical protein